jgi:hypothetical protein
VATPIARVLHMDCVDPQTQQLRPESGCNKSRLWWNDFSDAVYDRFWKKPIINNGEYMADEQQQVEEQIDWILAVSVTAPDIVSAIQSVASGKILSVNPRIVRPPAQPVPPVQFSMAAQPTPPPAQPPRGIHPH